MAAEGPARENVRLACKGEAALGECPVWSAADRTLFWLDCRAPAFHAWAPGLDFRRSWPLPDWAGSFALRDAGGVVLATATGFWALDLGTGALAPLAKVAAHKDIRFNDGKCDPLGNFWSGQNDSSRQGPRGGFWRLDPDHRAERMDGAYTVFNALTWSPDGTRMYSADSWTRTIYAHDFNPVEGTLGETRIFAVTEGQGMPDGATTDTEGGLWVAMFDGWRLCRYAPDGRLDREIALPVQRPTSCTFGGPGLATLFVTTARVRLTEEELSSQPLAGSILALEPGAQGLPAVSYKG